MGPFFFFFQAEDGIRDLVRSRGLGDVYKRQGEGQHDLGRTPGAGLPVIRAAGEIGAALGGIVAPVSYTHLTLPTIYSV